MLSGPMSPWYVMFFSCGQRRETPDMKGTHKHGIVDFDIFFKHIMQY